MEFHPLANIFPLLTGEPWDAFLADIAAQGICEPIWTYEGQVLDGRNRAIACEQLGIECPSREYEGTDPVGFVISMNLQRRHLDESQRGMVAARLANMRQGERTDIEPCLNLSKVDQGQAAELLNVSRSTVQQARKVQQEAAPEVVAAIDRGDMTITAALPLVDLPIEVQPQVYEELRRETPAKRPTATQARAAVSRVQVVATVKDQLAAGKTPKEAVTHAMQKHEIVLPTPAMADAIAQATNRQVTLAASDGLLHDGRTKHEEAAIQAETRRLFQLFNALEGLATLTNIPALLQEIPHYQTYRVSQYLDQASSNLALIVTLWEEQHDDLT